VTSPPPHVYRGCGRPKPLPIDSIFYKSDPNYYMQRQLFTAISSGKLKKVLTAHPIVYYKALILEK